jgi:rRNA processing protein Krr1/Pno1
MPATRWCTWHRGTAGNTNAHRHGRHSSRNREIQALGRVLKHVTDLARAQIAVMNSHAHGDPHRVEIAEKRVSRCMQRLAKAALALDRVLVDRGDENGLHQTKTQTERSEP